MKTKLLKRLRKEANLNFHITYTYEGIYGNELYYLLKTFINKNKEGGFWTTISWSENHDKIVNELIEYKRNFILYKVNELRK